MRKEYEQKMEELKFQRSTGEREKLMIMLPALLRFITKDKDIIHIDECHELDKTYQTALYLAIDKRSIFVNGKRSQSPHLTGLVFP